ncbi:MAG: hypothetical protein QM760_03495 [Nibricoccus sp.]
MLRAQPLLRAPSSLEQRVRAEMVARAARPWWRRSFSGWPLLPRAAFCALSGCAAMICIAATVAMVNGPGTEMAAKVLRIFFFVRDGMHLASDWALQWLGTVSVGWFFLAGGVVAAAGAGLLGIGATAYGLLWKDR